MSLLKAVDLSRKKVRLIGISVSQLKNTFSFSNLIDNNKSRGESLTEAIDVISNKFGESKLTLARIIKKDNLID